MKVLHVVDNLGVGGTELALARLIEGTRTRVQHTVCALREGGPVADRLRAGGTAVHVLAKAAGNDWRLSWRIAGVCRAERPDVVHTRNWGSIEGVVAARLARVPVAIHGEHGRHADDPEGKNLRRNRVRRWLAPFIDRIVTVSEQLREWLVHDVGIRAPKVLTIPNGVDPARYASPVPRGALRQRFGCAPNEFVVGTVGRLDPVKHQAALIEAAARLGAGVPVRVVVVGDGPERGALEARVARLRLDNVQLLGQRDDIPELFAVFDLFVLPSLAEGMCNTLLEAMAAGVPVVATRVGGNPEIVRDGDSGTLVPADDPAALAAAIARYAQDAPLRARHAAAGRARVQQCFTLERMLARYLAVYGEALGARGRAVPAGTTPAACG